MISRPRRNRKSPSIRGMIRETYLSPDNLIYPLFLIQGENIKSEIKSLKNQYRLSIDNALKEIKQCKELGLNNFVLFPVIPEDKKDKYGSYSYSDKNFYLEHIRKIKETFPETVLMSDVALDPYSEDGHDGVVRDGKILNDLTLPILEDMALAQAHAGIDIIGPSDMMDGRVERIRKCLDKNKYEDISIMSYTAKYASAYYGPFRDALDSAPKSGDKKTYQMDPANKSEALREATLDELEGADFLMVKPALCYLDIIHMLKEHSELPIAAYNVSGECAMIYAAAEQGLIDFEKVMFETLLSIKRAGATSILTYFAKEFAELYKAGKIEY